MESTKRKAPSPEPANTISDEAGSKDPSPRRSKTDHDSRRKRRDNREGGFRWKRKENREDERDGQTRLERGYRNRSPSPRRKQETKGRSTASVEDKFGVADKFGASTKTKNETEEKRPEPATSVMQPAAAAAHGEEMIIVHVNDRLGTKAAIPCLASDPIKLFKAQVAARIGRQPHEIMLKRQGERPFKDQLTLEDYGVSNGVQIDLEIDTGE